jgi:hypothetical protein
MKVFFSTANIKTVLLAITTTPFLESEISQQVNILLFSYNIFVFNGEFSLY